MVSKNTSELDLVARVSNGDLDAGWCLLMRYKTTIYKAIRHEIKKHRFYYASHIRTLFDDDDLFQNYLLHCHQHQFNFLTKSNSNVYPTVGGLVFQNALYFVNKFLHSNHVCNDVINVNKNKDVSELFYQSEYTKSAEDDLIKTDATNKLQNAIKTTFDKIEAEAFEIITGYKFGMAKKKTTEKKSMLSKLYGINFTEGEYYKIKRNLIKRFKASQSHLKEYISM